MKRLQEAHLENMATILLFFTMFFLTLWHRGADQCLNLIIVLALLYKPWRQQLFSLDNFKSPIILLMLGFFCWIIFTTLVVHSIDVPWKNAWHGIKVYDRLLYLLVLPLVVKNLKQPRWIEQGLIYGVFINVILSAAYYSRPDVVLEYFSYYPLGQGVYTNTPFIESVFNNNPQILIFVVVLACWILVQRILRRGANFLDVVVFVLLSLYVWVINIERTGYLLYLALFVLTFYQQGRKAFFCSLFVLPFILILLYEGSPVVKSRINRGYQDVVAFRQGPSDDLLRPDLRENSLGLRLTFLNIGTQLIKLHPLAGTGAGSYFFAYYKLVGWPMTGPPNNIYTGIIGPDNLYMSFVVEIGIVGLILYLCWLLRILYSIKKLPLADGNILRGLVWMILVSGLSFGSLAFDPIRLSFIILLSLYANEQLWMGVRPRLEEQSEVAIGQYVSDS